MSRFSVLSALIAGACLVVVGCDAQTTSSCSVETLANGAVEMSCSDGSSAVIQQPTNGLSCTVLTQDDGGHLLSCEDGTEALLTTGIGGSGVACTLTELDDASRLLECSDGTSTTITDGVDGQPGASCTIVTEAGVTKLVCPDGTEAILNGTAAETSDDANTDPSGDDTPVGQSEDTINASDLSPDDIAKIDILRDAIEQGLELGTDAYMEKISSELSAQGVEDNYEGEFEQDYSLSTEPTEACPFVKNLGNTVPSTLGCDYLADMAKLDAHTDLVAMIDANPLPTGFDAGDSLDEATFWYEQGAISGIEERRVVVRSDLKTSFVCNVNPTPEESSYDKGLIVGAQAMADAFNDWLAANGHVADYPAMTTPIEVCNVNVSALDPAHQTALSEIPTTAQENPLCDGYTPTDNNTAVQYQGAQLDYEDGIQAGIEAEYALAAVRIFKVVPCNVGDPLVVDLDGDGIELKAIHHGVNFDFYGVGSKQGSAWVSADDALLVMDGDGDGAITSGLELFGNVDQRFADGFTHLATFDHNSDGVIDARDPVFSELRLWQDNGDAVSSPDELLTLDSVGLTSIPLQAGAVSMRSEGVRIPAAVQAGRFLIGDAFFTTSPFANPRL